MPTPPDANRRFVFAPDVVDETQGLRLIEAQGAWLSHGFQALLEVPPPPRPIEPVVAPRPGHTALVLAAGIANGAILDTAQHGRVALRGKTQQVEQVARIEQEPSQGDPDHPITRTTLRLKPTTTFTLLGEDGAVIELEGDEALLGFIGENRTALADYLNRHFAPMYGFDFSGIRPFLDGIKLNGKYPLYTAQKHVVAAITRGFQQRKGILLVGSMGTGKTAMGGAAAVALASGVIEALRGDMRPDQVVLIVAPPHLIKKWEREVRSIAPKAYIARLDRHEDVKAFMEKAATLSGSIPKIGLIKRDLTKLGAGFKPAVVWRQQPFARWRYGQPTPDGFEPQQRLARKRVPQCPHCGGTVMREEKGSAAPATESWLTSGRRTCNVCHTPLWQEERDLGSRPKPGEKYPTKNPRYRLDVRRVTASLTVCKAYSGLLI